MTFHVRTSPFLTVTVDGVTIPGAWVDQATDGVSPEVGSATIRVPLGKTLFGSTLTSTDLSVAMRGAVVITDGGSYTWNGEVVSKEEIGADGTPENPGGRWLIIECQGDAAALERCYLSTWRELDYGAAAPVQTFHARDLNEGRNRDRSNAASLVNGQSIYISDRYTSNRTFWSQADAINSILCIANADAGLPLITLDDPFTLMAKLGNQWSIAGRSVHAMLATIIGQRSDATWKIGRSGGSKYLQVRPSSGGGSLVDLTTPFIGQYSHKLDGRSTLKGVRSVGGRQQFIRTFTHYPGGGGGDLIADWSGADVTALQAGDLNSPAYRLFRVDPSVSLPDGFSAGNGRVMGGLPIMVTDLAGPTIVGGPGYSSQAIIMYQEALTGAWISLDGQVSVSVRADGAGIWLDGSIWQTIYKTAYRVAVTLCIESVGQVYASRNDGDGTQWGFLSVPGDVVQMVTGTYLGVSSGGTVVTGAGTFRNDTARMQALLDAWWAWYQSDGVTLSWTEKGIAGGSLAPGDIVSSAKLFKDDGATTKTVTIDCPVIKRTVRWTEKGAQTSWITGLNAPDFSAISGTA